MPTGLERQVGRSVRRGLSLAEQGAMEAPGIGQLQGGFQGLLQLLQQLEQERGRAGQITSATPEIQGLAQQAAFAPLQGMQPFLQEGLLQAQQFGARRGLGQGSIAAAQQARAIPQIMGPALAQAQGRFSELLLELPLRERQLALQSVGLGGELAGQQAGVIGQQAGLRESAFNQLLSAQARGQEEAQLQRSRRGGLGRLLGGLGGALAGGFLGPVGAALGGRIGGMLGGGGGGGGGGGNALSQFSDLRSQLMGGQGGMSIMQPTQGQNFFVANPTIQTPGQR